MVFARSSLDFRQFHKSRHAGIVQGEIHLSFAPQSCFEHCGAAGYNGLVLFRLLNFMCGTDAFQAMWRSFDGRELLRLGRALNVIIHGRDGC